MKEFICIECKRVYNEQTVPEDFVCKGETCPGQGLTGLCIEHNKPSSSASNNGTPTPPVRASKECGLCVLLMDASGSMFMDPAFKNIPVKSQYGKSFCSKAELVSKTAAQAVFELQQMTAPDNAYICIIKFDTKQGLILNNSVREIIDKFQSSKKLAKHLYDELETMRGGTNINAALNLGYSYVNKFIQSKIPGMEEFAPLYHTQFILEKNDAIEIPNIRIMMYSDGEQLEEFGPIINPFENEETDLLLGAYVGDTGDKGCKDLKSIIGKCPIHQQEQFTVLDRPSKIASLRGFFRMASGTSGFCQECLNGQTVQLR